MARQSVVWMAVCCTALWLAGCGATPDKPAPRAERPRPAPPAPPPAALPPAPDDRASPADDNAAQTSQAIYAEGLRLYRAGQYDDAIARFAAVQSPPSLRVQALKHTAFGYCVTNRLPLCQRAFQDALALSPAFRLTKAEQGHPVWGPVFTKALQQSQPARRR
ncbi:MAG: TssQ family T6SS-associated lipoprotein [Ottowia sp.]|nr:TssQ family T6SS-associated lipoprotein [Ottowia sp.]